MLNISKCITVIVCLIQHRLECHWSEIYSSESLHNNNAIWKIIFRSTNYLKSDKINACFRIIMAMSIPIYSTVYDDILLFRCSNCTLKINNNE